MSQQSGEKTEQPTAKRLREARKKGQVAKSQDLSSALMLLAAVSLLWVSGGYVGELFLNGVKDQISYAASFKGDFNQQTVFDAFWSGLKLFMLALAPFLGIMLVAAFASNYFQIGSVLSVETVKPSFNKLNPTENFKNKFLKARSYIELGKTVLKILITGIVVTWVLVGSANDLVRLTNQPVTVAIPFTFNLVINIFFNVALAFLIIGAVDYFLQRYLHRKELMMTKHEVKEEYKEMEGDPYIKARRRFLHREIVSQSMASAVKTASVVVANPTHLAVALRYERGEMTAPVIVAKGADLMAAQIRQIAEESGVPVTRDVPLARALYELDVEDEIPEEMYEAVAIVLRWVYELSEESKN